MSGNQRLDLTPLDPSRDRDRWERLIRAIAQRAAPELARRAQEGGVLSILGHWVWPTLAAAAVAVVISGAVLAGARAGETEVLGGIADALGLDDPLATWIEEGRGPDSADLLLVMEQEIQ